MSSLVSSPPSSTATTRGGVPAVMALLLARAGVGETAAFAELYDATSSRVYGLALRIVRSPAQAEEVVQESYVEIWRTSSRFDPSRGSAISWIMMITHAAAVDRVRSAQARTRREEAYQRQVQPLTRSASDATTELVFALFDATRVHAALAQLPAAQREVLLLVHFEGHTHAEIALQLGLPLGTVKSRIRDGHIRLRGLLGQH
ncbi:MAG: sigma-70 family RNA polymerase sigma factor [Nocardioides sp.]